MVTGITSGSGHYSPQPLDRQRLASGNPLHPNSHTLGISGCQCQHSANQHLHFLLSATPTQVLTPHFHSPFQGMLLMETFPSEPLWRGLQGTLSGILDTAASWECGPTETTTTHPPSNSDFNQVLSLNKGSFTSAESQNNLKERGAIMPPQALLPEGQQLYWEDPSLLEKESWSWVSFSAPSHNLVHDEHILFLLLTEQGCPWL